MNSIRSCGLLFFFFIVPYSIVGWPFSFIIFIFFLFFDDSQRTWVSLAWDTLVYLNLYLWNLIYTLTIHVCMGSPAVIPLHTFVLVPGIELLYLSTRLRLPDILSAISELWWGSWASFSFFFFFLLFRVTLFNLSALSASPSPSLPFAVSVCRVIHFGDSTGNLQLSV